VSLRRTFYEVTKIQSGAKFGLAMYLPPKTKVVKTVIMGEGLMDTEIQAGKYDNWVDFLELCFFRIELPSALTLQPHDYDPSSQYLERKASQLASFRSQGTVLKYGAQVQLRHVHSGSLLSLSLLRAGIEPGTFKVSLEPRTKAAMSCLTLLPENKLQKIGEHIKYGDRVNIMFQDGGLKYFLQLHAPAGSSVMEINGSHNSSAWVFGLYADFDASPDTVMCSIPLRIRLVDSPLHLAEKRGDSEVRACLRSDPHDFSGLWLLERSDLLQGGNLHYAQRFFLKNAQSGRYLASDLSLQREHPDLNSTLELPKPDAFPASAPVAYNFPLIFAFPHGKVAAKSSERKEEILSRLVPYSHISEEATSDVQLEAEVMVQRGELDREVLFEFIAVERLETEFYMQVAKLLPKVVSFVLALQEHMDEGSVEDWDEEALETAHRISQVIEKLTAGILATVGSAVVESRQNAIVGLRLHTALINLALKIAQFRLSSDSSPLKTRLKRLFVEIWQFLIEVVADNPLAASYVEQSKDAICKMVKLEQRLIGSLLTEVYRLTDPDMPNYEQDFTAWCGRLKTLKEKNLEKQTVFLRLIQCLCEVGVDAKPEYQRVVLEHLFRPGTFQVLKLEKRNKRYFVHFAKKDPVEMESFEERHPGLQGDAELLEETGEEFVNLVAFRRKPAYVHYIYAVLNLVSTLCKGEKEDGRLVARVYLGLTPTLVFGMLKDLSLHIKLREACLVLADSLLLSCPPARPSLARKENDQCYIAEQLRDFAPFPAEFIDPLDGSYLQTSEVRICLNETLVLWMQMDMPQQVKGAELRDLLDYLIAGLKLAYVLLNYEKCSSLYVTCLLRTLVYLLIGLSDSHDAPRRSRRHWTIHALKNIDTEANSDLEVRSRRNELFRLLVELLLAICAHVRQEKCLKLLHICITETEWETEPDKVKTEAEDINDSAQDRSQIKRMTTRATEFLTKYGEELENTMDLADSHPAARRSVLTQAPDVRNYLFRMVLSLKTIPSGLKDRVILLLKRLFNEEVRIGKFLANVDLIADPELISSYQVLSALRAKVRIADLAADCRLELRAGGEGQALKTLCDLLEYVTNYINPRKRLPGMKTKKLQNIMRHLQFHREFMMLWPLCLQPPLSPSLAVKRRWERIRALLSIFLLYFCRQNDRNCRELRTLFSPSHYFLTVPQYPEVIREVSDYETLSNDSTAQLISYILSHHDEELRAFAFIRAIMFDREGNPKPDVQNIAGRLVAEKLFTCVLSPQPDLTAGLIELQALSCCINAHTIVQSRNILSLRDLKSMSQTHSPQLHTAILPFLYFAYLRQEGAVEPSPHTATILDIVQNTLRIAEEVMERTMDLVDAGNMGLTSLVFPRENPTLVDQMMALQPLNPLRISIRLLYYQGHHSPNGGVLDYLPRIFDSIFHSPELCLPIAQDFLVKLDLYTDRIATLAASNPELDFSLLQAAVSSCTKKLTLFIQLLDPQEGLERKRGEKERPVKPARDEEAALEQKLRLFTSEYREVMMEGRAEDYIRDLVGNFLRVAFDGGFPKGKVAKEAVNSAVVMLERVQNLFSGTRNRRLYFKFLRDLIPEISSPSDLRKKYVFNQIFLKTDVIEEALDTLIKGEATFAVNSTLQFLNKLLKEQTKAFQDTFQSLLVAKERAYYLFSRFARDISSMRQVIVERASSTSARLYLTPSGTLAASDIAETADKIGGQELYIVNVMVFLQLCCDNCNLDFQNYIRSQQASLVDVDLVSELALFVIELSAVSDYVSEHKAAGKMLMKAFAALLDFVTGPCPGNQLVLGTNVQLFLAINKLMKKVQTDFKPVGRKIHTKIVLFLHTLLEGNAQDAIYQTLLSFMDLGALRTGLETVYSEHIRGQEAALNLESASPELQDKTKVLILQALFLLKLADYSEVHTELKKFAPPSPAYVYFVQFAGYVEVERMGNIQPHYFPIPFKCKFLTSASRLTLLMEVKRSSHQKKIEDFLSRVPGLMREMEHQQALSRRRHLKSFISQWQLFAQASFSLVFVINLQLLFTIKGSLEETIALHPMNVIYIAFLGVLQLIMYMVSFLFNVVEYFPSKLDARPVPQGIEIARLPHLPHNESQYVRSLYYELTTETTAEAASFESSLRSIGQNMDFYYNYVYFLVSVAALYYPLLYPFLMLDLVKQNQELINVLRSITVNARQLLITLFLGLIIIFLFSSYAFVFFQDDYTTGNMKCLTLLDCFISTLHMGIRSGGGIGDFVSLPDHENANYWNMVGFDMLFYLIIIIILLNIIFGIIIDTFAQLRSQREAVLRDINNVCYVCGLDRGEIERKGKGWMHHFMIEHSPLAYLAFLVYLIETPIVDCTGIEKYVKEKSQRRDATFMPTSSRLIRQTESRDN